MHLLKNISTKFRNSKKYIDDTLNFVNSRDFSSNTNYFIWVDLSNFKVNIFNGKNHNWTLSHSYPCTIGKPSTPTPKGSFITGIKGLYFGVEKGYKCWYYTQFNGNYLFHSIIYNLDGSIKDGRLGMALSDGCVRLSKINAKWIYDNIPSGTKVFIS